MGRRVGSGALDAMAAGMRVAAPDSDSKVRTLHRKYWPLEARTVPRLWVRWIRVRAVRVSEAELDRWWCGVKSRVGSAGHWQMRSHFVGTRWEFHVALFWPHVTRWRRGRVPPLHVKIFPLGVEPGQLGWLDTFSLPEEWRNLGLGGAVYQRIAKDFPGVRWQEHVTSASALGVRRRLHLSAPFTWEYSGCPLCGSSAAATPWRARSGVSAFEDHLELLVSER